jgi:hypothetical protein
MTFMLCLAALNTCFTLCLLLMGANKEAAFTGLGTAFCAAGALLNKRNAPGGARAQRMRSTSSWCWAGNAKRSQ